MAITTITNSMTAVEQTLQDIVDSDVKVLRDASQHIISSGGKRIRPHIALLAYLAAGGNDPLEAVPMAAAIEMVHTATLVHDDINDHSQTRRGKIAVHARWGRTFALLTGDYLFTKVYELMAPYGGEFNVIMADACIKLVEGETLQAAAAKSGMMDRETYKTIIARKTASLFEAGASMGGMLANASAEIVKALTEYAYNLGLTFQIVDDILDIVGDPETLGKPVGADLAQNRGVMAVRNGDALATIANGGKAVTAVADADPFQEMMSQLRDSGAVDVARLQAQETAVRARNALKQIPPSPARNELEGLIDMVLDRDK
ncbi:MAG: polyprenyl synthetase family protein [Anaerolineae bacterium]